jgi:lysozyme family protein
MQFTLPWETGKEKDGSLRKDGGLHYQDGGLATKYGIWKGANRDVDVESLTVESATVLYKARYWDVYITLKPISANLDNLPTALAVAVFDSGVNCGPNRGITWLGKALENKNPVKVVLDQRGAFYQKRDAEEKAKGKKYPLAGLINRLNDLRKYCEILETEDQARFAKIKPTRPLGFGHLS